MSVRLHFDSPGGPCGHGLHGGGVVGSHGELGGLPGAPEIFSRFYSAHWQEATNQGRQGNRACPKDMKALRSLLHSKETYETICYLRERRVCPIIEKLVNERLQTALSDLQVRLGRLAGLAG